MDLHTEAGSLHAGKWSSLVVRKPDQPERTISPPALPEGARDEWSYLHAVVRGTREVEPLTALELNVTVAEILDEARRQIAAARADEARAKVPAQTTPNTHAKPSAE
jgi:hypothetical protein